MGYVTITDAIKATSVAAIKELMRQGIEVIMLTGIIKNTAKAADELHHPLSRVVCLRTNSKKFKDCKQKGKFVWRVM
jgi:Cu2+-exporting ATPase